MTHTQAVTLLLFQKAYDPNFRRVFSDPAKDVDAMLARLRVTAQEWIETEWKSDEVKDIARKTIENLERERLRQYAEKIFNECKREQGIKFQVSQGAPPTHKQLAMLKSLGSREVPSTSSAASAIIGRLLAKKKEKIGA